MYCFAGAISSPPMGTQCTKVTNTLVIGIVEGQSRSVIRSYGCDQKGRRLGGGTRVKQVRIRSFLKDVTEGLFLIWKRKEFQRTGA